MHAIERSFDSEYCFSSGTLFLNQCGELTDVERICAFFSFSKKSISRYHYLYIYGRGHDEFDALLDLRFKAERFGCGDIVKSVDSIVFGDFDNGL